MNLRLFRILTILLSYFFLTGFVPILSLVGPGVTALTSGSIYKASAQFMVNQYIEKETGKNSFALIKETLVNEKIDNQNLQKLLKKRIEITRSVLKLNNINQ